jgi:hypothetical protein
LVWGDDGWIYFTMSTAEKPDPQLVRMRPTGPPIEGLGTPPPGLCQLSGSAKRWECLDTQQLSDLFLIRNLKLP